MHTVAQVELGQDPSNVGADRAAGKVQLTHGTFLNEATIRYPTTVLGFTAAQKLGIADLAGSPRAVAPGRQPPQPGVALLVGGIGIANVMVISVLERRTEIGLRRALGAARQHVAAQFLTESVLLRVVGGTAGVFLGAAITYALAYQRGWQPLIPPAAIGAGLTAAVVIGALAGLYPALRAAHLSPTDALRTA